MGVHRCLKGGAALGLPVREAEVCRQLHAIGRLTVLVNVCVHFPKLQSTLLDVRHRVSVLDSETGNEQL